MSQARIWPLVGLSFMASGLVKPAWSDAVGDSMPQASVYLCQFGDTVQSYAFEANAAGQLEGVGPLKGWTAEAQAGGLVARNAGQMLIIGEGLDSFVQDGQLVQGQCADATDVLAQLNSGGGVGTLPGNTVPGNTVPDNTVQTPSNANPTDLALPEADASASDVQPQISDDWLAGMLAILDPQAWDAAKVAAIVDVLSMDDSAKMTLKAALRAAGTDPSRIRAVARQVQYALGAEIASAARLRARLQNTRRDLDAATSALDEQRQRVQMISAQLDGAEARAGAAERAQSQISALLGAAQRALSLKNAELGRAAQSLAALNFRLVATQQQVVTLQTALKATAEDQQNATLQIGVLTEQLADMRARLARANDRIDELKAGKK